MDYQERKNAWLNSSRVSAEDKEMIRKADEATLQEMFGSNLAFGTAGMRALLGPGCARLNLLTVRRATIGVAKFLLQRYGPHAARERGVAISFDNRHYSKEFRDTAATVFTEMGIKVYTFRDPHPTPELSYTVRTHNCVGGLMITASHNPREYNGYKFYDEKGCQGVYGVIDGLIAVIDSLPDELSVDYDKVVDSKAYGTITYLDDDVIYDSDFVNKEVSTSLYLDEFRGPRLTKIIFSPECGCDCKVGPMALRKAGYEVRPVPGQDFFDPDFKGTENPNPETEGAYKGAYAELKKQKENGKIFNLILVTDPDADRCGLAFLDKKGEIRHFTGNQTGALLIDFVLGTLERRNQLPPDGVICNTFVTGGQGAKVAQLYNVKVRTTATGFKYIGNMADRLQAVGEKYLFGYEESYGYLLQDFVRDKDSLQSIVAIADMTEYYLRQGKTLDVAYEELSKRTGRYYNTQVSVAFPGADSLRRMNEEIAKLRSNPPKVIGDAPVAELWDYETRNYQDFLSGTNKSFTDPDIDVSNCLRFNFAEGGFIAIRPSGTEPKVKFYFEVLGKKDDEAEMIVEKRVADLKKRMGLE
jgi:phosphoglucomutase